LDRIDLHVEVVPISYEELSGDTQGEGSNEIRERVIKARLIQSNRFESKPGVYCNAQMGTQEIEAYCKLDETSKLLLKNAMDKLGLSARAYDRILKVARTIADLDNTTSIISSHIAEAIQFRSLDREGWAG
jgi:magnesium chelatase family protein